MNDHEILREIRDEIRGLRSDLALQHHPQTRDAHESLATMLRCISEFVGDRAFSVRELIDHAGLPVAADLQAAIAASLGGTLNGKRLGRLFRQIEGRDVEGLRIVAIGSDRDGVIWALRL